MHDHELHVCLRDGLGFRAVHVEPARLEQVHGEMLLVRGLGGVAAAGRLAADVERIGGYRGGLPRLRPAHHTHHEAVRTPPPTSGTTPYCGADYPRAAYDLPHSHH